MAYQILNPGIVLWFAPDGNGVVGYVNAGGYRVVAGAPICATERLEAVVSAFETDAHRHRQRICYFGAQDRLIHMLQSQRPVARLLIGAQPTWSPETWDTIVTRKSSLRGQIARGRNKGVTVEQWRVEQAVNHPELRRCLHEWLQSRGLPPMRFLVEPQTLNNLADRRVYVAERAGHVVGYLVASPVPLRHGWLVEQIIRGKHAPNGTVELLLDAAMRDAAASRSDYITLGLSPLSRYGLPTEGHAPFWMRLVLAWVRAHTNRFYNFAGLDQFKAKFQPAAWEPIYAVSSETATSFRTLYAIAWAFSGKSPISFISHALVRALRQEIMWFVARRVRPAIGRLSAK